MKRALQHFLCGLLMLGLLWIPLAYAVLGMFGIGVAL